MSNPKRVYRRLAQAFPHEFKLAYGAEVTQVGDEVLDDLARRHGAAGLIRLIADIAIRLPLEYLSEMRRDVRYGARALVKSPGFALVGIISLGIGMGLTTRLYNSKWQLISRELPAAANARRLVMPEKAVSYYYVEQFRKEKNSFAGVAALETGIPFNVTLPGNADAKPERVFGQLVSADYFSVLGVEPLRGRLFSPELDRPGDAPVVVISDRFWRNRLNASPDAIGQSLRLNGQPAAIIGITPRGFNGALPINPSELFVPVTSPAALAPELAGDVLHQRQAKEFLALMCLRPGVTMASAEAALEALTRRLDQEGPAAPPRAEKGRRVTLLSAGAMVPLPPELRSVLSGFFFALMALMMTITCMNLANMQLARAAHRRKEVAIRLAVGASRFRIVRQMMSEGILLSLLGGVGGFALAYGLEGLTSRFTAPTAIPTESQPHLDWHAAIFVLALAILGGIGFSLAPALRATKGHLIPALKEGSALQFQGYGRFGLRNVLIVAQVAGSLMLLLITGFLVIGISQTSRAQTKFDPRTMYLFSLDPVRDGYTPEKAQALFEKLPQQLKAAGAVRSVALAAVMPFAVVDEDGAVPVTAEDGPGASRVQISAIEETVGAGYFAALSEPILAGREFEESDQRGPADRSRVMAAVLNETAAHRFFGNGRALGRRLSGEDRSYEVVGVVHDLGRGNGMGQAVIYLPLTGHDFACPPAEGIIVMVRSEAGLAALGGIRREIASIDPNLTLFSVRTLHEYLELSRSAERFSADTYGGMGVFGLVLAAIGLAGVTAYAVAQRQKEIGIRMALGARKGQVLGLVLREGGALVTVGTFLGFLGAVALSKILSALTQVFVEAMRVGTNDPRLLLGAPLLLSGLALLACYIPARRAASIDPLKALRED